MRQRFQGKCFQSLEGWRFMEIFDQFPRAVRERLRASPFNLCAACVEGVRDRLGGDWFQAIEVMEDGIRWGE